MKVLQDALKAVSKGATVPLIELGLPVKGAHGTLIVFWKEK